MVERNNIAVLFILAAINLRLPLRYLYGQYSSTDRALLEFYNPLATGRYDWVTNNVTFCSTFWKPCSLPPHAGDFFAVVKITSVGATNVAANAAISKRCLTSSWNRFRKIFCGLNWNSNVRNIINAKQGLIRNCCFSIKNFYTFVKWKYRCVTNVSLWIAMSLQISIIDCRI